MVVLGSNTYIYMHLTYIQHNICTHYHLLTSQDMFTLNPVTLSGVVKLGGIRLHSSGESRQMKHVSGI